MAVTQDDTEYPFVYLLLGLGYTVSAVIDVAHSTCSITAKKRRSDGTATTFVHRITEETLHHTVPGKRRDMDSVFAEIYRLALAEEVKRGQSPAN